MMGHHSGFCHRRNISNRMSAIVSLVQHVLCIDLLLAPYNRSKMTSLNGARTRLDTDSVAGEVSSKVDKLEKSHVYKRK